MKKRPFLKGVLNHCYQRSANGGLLFYSQSDYLVWFTIVCLAATRHRVKILALCPMPDHTHLSVIADSVRDLSSFMGDINRSFSHEQNKLCHTKGSWFKTPFGSVPKKGAKFGRSNLLYVGNNPVERKLASYADEYRWTFVAYAHSDHPFSDKLIIRNCSRHMRNAIREVRAQYRSGKPMNHCVLKRITRMLAESEKRQLIDYIVSTYNVISYDDTLSYFDGSYGHFLTALHSTTTREYDMKETFVGVSDRCYAQMTRILLVEKGLEDIHDFLAWPEKERKELYNLLLQKTGALPSQVNKFLHLPIESAKAGMTTKR